MDTPHWFALGAVGTGLVSLALQIAVLFVDRDGRGSLFVSASPTAVPPSRWRCRSLSCSSDLMRQQKKYRMKTAGNQGIPMNTPAVIDLLRRYVGADHPLDAVENITVRAEVSTTRTTNLEEPHDGRTARAQSQGTNIRRSTDAAQCGVGCADHRL
nr:hypothetical protein [Rhodococcus qingshengii]